MSDTTSAMGFLSLSIGSMGLNCLSSFRVASRVEGVSRHPRQRKTRSMLLYVGWKPCLSSDRKSVV